MATRQGFNIFIRTPSPSRQAIHKQPNQTHSLFKAKQIESAKPKLREIPLNTPLRAHQSGNNVKRLAAKDLGLSEFGSAACAKSKTSCITQVKSQAVAIDNERMSKGRDENGNFEFKFYSDFVENDLNQRINRLRKKVEQERNDDMVKLRERLTNLLPPLPPPIFINDDVRCYSPIAEIKLTPPVLMDDDDDF